MIFSFLFWITIPDGYLKDSFSAAWAVLGGHRARVRAGRVVGDGSNRQSSVRVNGQVVVEQNVFEILLPRDVDVRSDVWYTGQIGWRAFVDEEF